MKRILSGSLLVVALAGSAAASDLDLAAQSGGAASVEVFPGAAVPYEVVGELGDGRSEGLALVLFDLSFSGGPLGAADAPSTAPMESFASPLGLSNPAGFGGTPAGGDLIQVGGGQNTIRNVFAPQPSGSVVVGVAQPGAPEVLVTGTLTAPAEPGTYVLSISNPIANVIRAGETGTPFWRVEAAGEGVLSPLEVIVLDCGTSTYCVGAPNSAGAGARMASRGSPSVAANDLVLAVSGATPSVFGLFYYGSTALAGAPFGDGFRCVGGSTFRLNPPATTNASGAASRPLDLTSPPAPAGQITAGSTWYFQFWYRDVPAMGAGFNLSDGLAATFCP